MRELGVLEARNRLSELLNAVELGEELLITRRGRPVAKLVPAAPGFDRAAARKAAEDIWAIGARQTLGGLTIKELVNEGRP